jgi:hypothetical protein
MPAQTVQDFWSALMIASAFLTSRLRMIGRAYGGG